MANDGSRIPAWRRLGLALKNESQSGVAVPEHKTSPSAPDQVIAYDAKEDAQDITQSPLEPAVVGKSSKLGKRKHQPEPAEDDGEASKKSRISRKEANPNGDPDLDIATYTNPGNADLDSRPKEPPVTETARPKGDPNYRRKKTKPNNRRRGDHEDAEVKHVQSSHEHTFDSTSPDEPLSTGGRSTLLASTETDYAALAPAATPRKHLKNSKTSSKDTSGSPPQTDRRKSVAFTPDTKTTDGNTGQDLFKKWVAEQKGTGPVSAPPEVSNFNLHSLIAAEEKAARKSGQLEKQPTEEATTKSGTREQSESPAKKPTAIAVNQTPTAHKEKISATSTEASTPKGKKKDPSTYISYLTQYHTDRDHWKFNKAKQNDVVDNALNIFRITDEHSEALIEYVSGLKGAGVIERLKDRCNALLKELDEQDTQNPITMDEPEARKAAQTDAQEERIAKERKRRKVEGDVEGLLAHPHGDGYIRRLRRKRAEALLTALSRTAPILPAVAQTNGINPMMRSLAPPPRRDSKKRKRRGEVSSDESSSDSSSDEESSSSDSDSEDSDSSNADSDSDAATSTTDSSNSNDSGSDSDSN
ncbi:Nn.00g014850.m01.CDS01 [Neocucurbitaria sp. VM-36]